MSIPPVKALVPMKHHSERVSGKNLRALCGRPLFHWIMDTLRRSPYIDEIVVNTDSDEIAASASDEFGATILARPEHLLGDMVGIQPLIEWDVAHTTGEYYLQTHSTNPLLRLETLNAAIEAFFDAEDHDSLFTVTALQTRLFWEDGRPINHDPDVLVRTQDLPPVYEENSCVYLFSRDTFEDRNHRLGAKPLLYPIDPLEAVDIDEEPDFALAEALMRIRLDAGERSGEPARMRGGL